MTRISVTIVLPTVIVELAVCLALIYRKMRYGYKYRRIPLTRGKYAIVDPKDYEWLVKYKWHANGRQGGILYAVNQKRQRMHRLIMNAPKEKLVDHINGNGLDNRRANLRLATYTQNSWNSRHGIGQGTSRYKGVIWYKRNKKWEAVISVNGRRKHLGYYKKEIDAARAFDKAAKERRGEFAVLNFPDS